MPTKTAGDGQRPEDRVADAAVQRPPVACADEPSRERLGRLRETVGHVGEEGEQLQQDGVDGQQCPILHAGRCAGEEGVDGYDAERADDDVAVDDQKAPDRPHVEDRRPVDARDELPIVGDDQHGGQRHAEILGDDRAVTDAGDAHPAAEGEEPRTADMDDVLQNGDPHGDAGVLHPDEPAVEAEEHDAAWVRPRCGRRSIRRPVRRPFMAQIAVWPSGYCSSRISAPNTAATSSVRASVAVHSRWFFAP